MSFVPSRMRSVIQRAVERFFNDTADIYVDAISITAQGGQDISEAIYKAGVPFRVIMAGNVANTTVGLVGEQVTLTNIYKGIAPRGTDIAINHKIVTGGHKYSVIANTSELTDDVFESVVMERQS